MNCPKCSTTNPDDGKFCKECGARLAGGAETAFAPVDDMSGALLDLWRCYDAGHLDEALSHAEELLDKLPESASARSVVALVWERKSERELASGNLEGGVAALKRAISEYEAILRLNPDSAADKSKLAALRRKLSGDIPEPDKAPRVFHISRYTLQWPPANLPTPVLAAVGVFLAVIILGSVLFGGGKKPQQPATQDQTQQYGASTDVYPTQPQQYPQAAQPPVNPQPQQAYTPVQPQNPPAQPQYQTNSGTRRSYGSTRPSGYVPPYALPTFGSGYSVVPDNSGSRRPRTTKKTPEDVIETQPPTPAAPTEAAPEEASPVPDDRQDADSMLAKAMQFRKIKNDSMAVAAAQQAVTLYESEIRAGRDVERCRRGIDTAKRLMAVAKENTEQE